jgi:serine O-acetyltransferase
MTEPLRIAELEAAIDRVAASYTGELEIDNLESAALPSEATVVEAFGHLEQALFIGFYATRAVDRDNLRYSVAEHLYAAHELLSIQIGRAQAYDRWAAPESTSSPKSSAEDVVLELIRQLPRLRALLEGDVQAAYAGDPSAPSIEEVVFSYPSIHAMTAYRIAHELRCLDVPMVPRIISEHAHKRTGIDINPSATIGERLFIDHGTGVVIGETAVIGNDVKIYQHVTLGALSVPNRDEDTSRQRHPTIEDDVTIYAGATILGGDTVVGRGSTIGGNVWLTRSVPAGSRVFPERSTSA